MKLFALASAVQAGIGDGARQLRSSANYMDCVKNAQSDSIDPNGVHQIGYPPASFVGRQSCSNAQCSWQECPPYYQPLPLIPGSARRMKCRFDKVKNEYYWNKPGLWDCKTCNDLEMLENNPDFNVRCASMKNGSVKVCDISCKNEEKIYPINKPRVKNVMCKCNKATKECNWVKGRAKYDLGDHMDFSKWSCPQVHQIPKHLKCMKNNYSGELVNRKSWDRIIGGKEVEAYSWPWVVRLTPILDDGVEIGCGGTILDEKDCV